MFFASNSFSGVVVFLCSIALLGSVQAQDQPPEENSCYGPGSIATAVILTIILLLVLQFLAYTTWKRYRKNRQDKREIFCQDPEKGRPDFSYDNPGFKGENNPKNDVEVFDVPTLFPPPLDVPKSEKQKSTDDFDLKKNEIKTVLLKSRDFTGLGFDIFGNMRDGIFIKDILQRGPAYESGQLSLGDRIKNVTINFDHIVYEDALAILSYASPYEVTLQTQKENNTDSPSKHTPTKNSRIGHPLFFKSPSFADLLQIGKSEKKVPESPTKSTPKTPERKAPPKAVPNNKITEKPVTHETSSSPPHKPENKFQKIGVRVLPMDFKALQVSPKSSELSQNDNNINLEINSEKSYDEVDRTPKQEENILTRTGSGIKRNKDGIPQEIPNFMLNAAVAARKNRKVLEIPTTPSSNPIISNTNGTNTNTLKSPKKQKGKAPAPPELEKSPVADKAQDEEVKVLEASDYVSDSDVEIEAANLVSKVIELDEIDVTIHQFEADGDDLQNRRTASTGDLTKIQNCKPNTNSLERAQSLDITEKEVAKISEFNGKPEGFEPLRGFQSNRLVKSNEWGNLEDAVLELVDSDVDRTSLPDTPSPSSNGDTLASNFMEAAGEIPFDPKTLGKWLLMERQSSSSDSYFEPHKIYSSSTNVPDDVKVSRHSLNGFEKSKQEEIPESMKLKDEEAPESLKLQKEETPERLKLKSNNTRNSYMLDTKLAQPDLISETREVVERPVEIVNDSSSSKLTYVTEIQLLPASTKPEVPNRQTTMDSNISSKLLVNQQIDPEKELHKIQEIAQQQLQKLPKLRYSSSFESSDTNGISQVNVVSTNQDIKVFPKAHCTRSESNASLKSRIPISTSKTPPTSPERRNSQNFDADFHRETIRSFVNMPMQRSLSSSTITINQKTPRNVTIQKIDFDSPHPKSRSRSVGKR